MESDSSSYSSISRKEFYKFHSVDRELFSTLVLSLLRDPMECMQIMALWLWLERAGFSKVVYMQLSLPFPLISGLADEALTCIKCINLGDEFASSSEGHLPLMQKFIDKQLSLKFFHRNRVIALNSITKILNDVCARAFDDIMLSATEGYGTEIFGHNNKEMMSSIQPSEVHTQVFENNQASQSTFRPPRAHYENVPAERTLFITFSKGYHVEEFMVWDLFTKMYGQCIEAVNMQKVRGGEQPLFAFVIFHSEEIIQKILNGNEKVKFMINKKHIWARKFEPEPPGNSASQP